MPEDKGEKQEFKGGFKPETLPDPMQPPKEGWKPHDENIHNLTMKEKMEQAGFIDPATEKHDPLPAAHRKLRINTDNGTIETVITPSDPELNMSVKPFCKVDSPAGQALINAGVLD